jgi:hypothetical protein
MAPRPEWLNAALEHQRAGRFAEAERICDAVLGANPAEADALHLLGLIAASRAQSELAGTMFARAITCKPNRPDFMPAWEIYFTPAVSWRKWRIAYRRALLQLFQHHPGRLYARSSLTPAATRRRRISRRMWANTNRNICRTFCSTAGFRRAHEGIFVDIGAHDESLYSNSFGSRNCGAGAASASNPTPRCSPNCGEPAMHNANCCVLRFRRSVPFLKISGYSEMLSGMVEKYEPEHRERVERELKQFGGSSEVILIQTRTLNDIAAECGLAEVTYLSIDTEGSELAILQSIDFKRLFVHAITVEYNFDHVKSRMISLMRGNGFDYVQTLGHDFLFLNRLSPFQGNLRRLRSNH